MNPKAMLGMLLGLLLFGQVMTTASVGNTVPLDQLTLVAEHVTPNPPADSNRYYGGHHGYYGYYRGYYGYYRGYYSYYSYYSYYRPYYSYYSYYRPYYSYYSYYSH